MKNIKILISLLSLGLVLTACTTSSGNNTQSTDSGSSSQSESVHQHTFGAMYYEVQPDFFHDGNIAYYECTECHQKVDQNYNEV